MIPKIEINAQTICNIVKLGNNPIIKSDFRTLEKLEDKFVNNILKWVEKVNNRKIMKSPCDVV